MSISPGRPSRPSRTSPGAAVLAALAAVLLVLGVGAPAATASAPSRTPPPATLPSDALDAPGVVVDPASPAPPAVTARSWIVADLDSGDVLAASNAHLPVPPASTIKLLTLLALAPGLDRATTYTATAQDAGIVGSKVGLDPGSVYTVDDLLHGMMLASGNDASSALASLSGGMPAATARMQDLADGLGATDTVVRNTSGLDAEGQVSSAFDLALVGRAVLERPGLAQIVTTRTYSFPGKGTTQGPERPRFEIANHNQLLTSYEGTLGLKNGYTRAARGSFVAGVERGGRRYLVALMAAEGVTWQLSRDLLDWALAGGGDGQPVGSLDPAGSEQVVVPAGGDGAGGDGADEGITELHQMELSQAGAGRPVGALAPGSVLLALALLVLGLRVRAVQRRRQRRMARRRELAGL